MLEIWSLAHAGQIVRDLYHLQHILASDVWEVFVQDRWMYRSNQGPPRGNIELLFTGDHSEQDQILSVKMGEYVGFCVYHRSYLLWSPVALTRTSHNQSGMRTSTHRAEDLHRSAGVGGRHEVRSLVTSASERGGIVPY